jgi:transketolase
MGIAAGMALSGKTVFASSFAVFATGRAYDQIRQSIAYTKANVKIVATHAGLTVGPDGGSHQALEDIALMRAIPGMTVLVPCDANETKEAVKAVAAYNGPVYVRLGREPVPFVLPEGIRFEIGKGLLLSPGITRDELLARRSGDILFDVAFVACGVMVKAALEAAEELKAQGIRCLVADFASVKPLDEELLGAIARHSKAIVAAEEHNVIGGLGSAVCESVCAVKPVPVKRVGVKDVFGQSGEASDLLRAYGLTAGGLVSAAKEALEI